ncbi:coiled-coil domain-containing protein 186 [Ceratitis capitata]|uniref:coiled-coil domain-containing protein 186 n=1 Tax=Ceratitis capitata TaxID=7213 RepID=UPI000329BF77|nr:coiled-coil domain-containing protein 186 [Ceratitis capitata]
MDSTDVKMDAKVEFVTQKVLEMEKSQSLEKWNEEQESEESLQTGNVTQSVDITKVESPVQEILDAVLQQKAIQLEPMGETAVMKDHEISNELRPMDTEIAMEATDSSSNITKNPPESGLQTPPSTGGSPSSPSTPRSQVGDTTSYIECLAQIERQRKNYEQQLEQMRTALAQKDNMITLYQRENAILDKEKNAFRKEKELANKEKESTVIKFAMKEKLLLDAKKEKEIVEKQLADAKKEVKNVTIRFQALHEEKSRMSYIIDEKCNEVRKYQRECEKLKTDYGHLESKLKYHANKLNIEIESRMALEKKLEEEKNAPNKLEEKANENLKMEYEANTILFKHEIKNKTDQIELLNKELSKAKEESRLLQEKLSNEILLKNDLSSALGQLQDDHNSLQNAYSEEMLNSAKLRCHLDELQVLKTQNTLNEEKIASLTEATLEMKDKLQDNEQDLHHLHARETELLSINKEISESIVSLQNEICLLKAQVQGVSAENDILRKEKSEYDSKYDKLMDDLKNEVEKKLEERQLLTKHLSEKTKLYEITKSKLENVEGDFEATKHKHATVIKELQRELQKYKKSTEHLRITEGHISSQYCSKCRNIINNAFESSEASMPSTNGFEENGTVSTAKPHGTHSRTSSQSSLPSTSRRPSETSESETMASSVTTVQQELQGPSKKHLVERILRLQQASARQTEKIDFLENHTLSLVAELQKKSKVVQYYMLRDQAGALTSTRSDQNKSELAKYGNGVMSAIYNGIKGDTKSMTLDLSLEINKKLQAVLEDTLLKNITLKENLDVLGLEVDNLTRKLRLIESRE